MVWEQKKTKTEDSGASTQRPKHHQPVPSLYKGGKPTVKGFIGCSLVVGGKGVYIWFPVMSSFGNIPCLDGILPKRGSKWLGPSDAYHRGRW